MEGQLPIAFLSEVVRFRPTSTEHVTMRAYSVDLRERIVTAVQNGQTRQSVAQRFAVSPMTVRRYVNQHQNNGSATFWIPLANSQTEIGIGLSRAKGDCLVLASGVCSSHSNTRQKFVAVAIIRFCRWLFALPT